MGNIIESVVECKSEYGVEALLTLCTLLGFIGVLILIAILAFMKYIPYIIDRITSYNDIRTKAKNNNTSVEVELHRRNDLETE